MEYSRLSIIVAMLLLTTPALAQQSSEQLMRQINAALAQENVRLGQENELLKQQIQQLQNQIKASSEKK